MQLRLRVPTSCNGVSARVKISRCGNYHMSETCFGRREIDEAQKRYLKFAYPDQDNIHSVYQSQLSAETYVDVGSD